MAMWACRELDFMPESSILVALLARFAAWLEASDAAWPVPKPQELCNVLGACAELQQHDVSVQPKRRPSWCCDPRFLDLCTAWVQQRYEQFTALDATDLLYSLTDSNVGDKSITNLVWAATRSLERTQLESYRLPPAGLGRLVQLCVAQWRAEQAVPIPGALRVLDSLPGQGLVLQAADPATAASLAWLAGWVFEQVAALPGGRAQEGFGVDAAAGLLDALAALRWQPSSQQAAAVVALCQWLVLPGVSAGSRKMFNTNDKLLDQIFNLKACGFTSKELVRASRKCEKEEKAEKLKVKKAIEKGNMEGAKIYAQNAIRKKSEALNYLKLASRLDAVVINKNMAGIVKSLAAALKANNLEKVAQTMDQFEKQFENLDVQSEFVAGAMDSQAVLSTPEEDVNLLMQQVADEHGLEVQLGMAAAPNRPVAQAAPAAAHADDLSQRLAELRR
eukprot:scaffold11.g3876.t1